MLQTRRAGTAVRPRSLLSAFGAAAAVALLCTTILVALLGTASRFDPITPGLNVTYYRNATWAAPAVATATDPVPSTQSFTNDWQGEPPDVFSATWTGSLLVVRGGRHTFATVSDDGSRLYVDGALIVDNGGVHGAQQATGSIVLARGVHSIFVDYFQGGGGYHLDVLWAREGEPLEPIPGALLTPRRTAFAPFLATAALRRGLVIGQWAWVATIVLAALAIAFGTVAMIRARLVADGAWPAVAWIVAGSTALSVIGIWWGLPGGAWAPDEITPISVISGAAMHFSKAWYNAYPPLHFYLLTGAFSPILLLDWLGRIDVRNSIPYLTMAIVGRLLTVVQASGTVLAAYFCGARAFGRRAGLAAAAIFALVAPFLYYAKTTNFDVPYLFWFGWSMVFYLRVLDDPRLADVIGFAVMATLAVCTKDQAYGLFVLPPFAIAWRLWRARARRVTTINAEPADADSIPRDLSAGSANSALYVVRDLAAAGAVAILLFAAIHNLAFNWTGFVLHLRDITGTRSSGYRMFAATPAGWLGLARLSAELVRLSMGWPMFLVCVAGLVVALGTQRYRRVSLWLIVPAASYYLTFLNVVLYTYDRFLLPICFVLALFGGFILHRVLLTAGRAKTVRVGAAAALFAYTFFYAAMVDVLMVRDSRYTVETWLDAHVRGGELVGFTFPLQYYPRLERFRASEIDSVEDLERDRPPYFIVDADYAQAEPPTSDIGRMIAGLENGRLGYRIAFRYRRPAPWPWLPGAHPDLVGPRLESHVYSTLHHINPTIEIFRRVG